MTWKKEARNYWDNICGGVVYGTGYKLIPRMSMKTEDEIRDRIKSFMEQPRHNRGEDCDCCRWTYTWVDALTWVLGEEEKT